MSDLMSGLLSKKTDLLYCPFCKKKMIWYVNTLLCMECDKEVIQMLRFEHDYKKMICK